MIENKNIYRLGIKVAETETGVPCGFITYGKIPFQPAGLVADLCVEKAVRSQGIGGMLLNAAEEDLLAAGAQQVLLAIVAGEQRAINFYAKRGYVPNGQKIGSDSIYLKNIS